MVETIGIVGNGVVGSATARSFMEWADVRVHDKVPERCTHRLGMVLAADLVFVCLPTPQKADSLEADTSALTGFFADLSLEQREACFVVKSTVPVGFTRATSETCKIKNIVHSPEFLTARCAFVDAQLPARNVIGKPDPPHAPGPLWSGGNLAAQRLNVLYHQRFPGVPVHLVTSDESEMVKLMLNSFFAVKIAYFNEVRSLCDRLGLEWGKVLEAVLADGRIAHSHTRVPGPDGNRGFSGSCLPKDLASMIHLLQEHLQPADHLVTRSAYLRNLEDRKR